MNFAVLVKDVVVELPWGGTIVAKEGVGFPIEATEHIGLIGDYHIELDPSDYKIIQ